MIEWWMFRLRGVQIFMAGVGFVIGGDLLTRYEIVDVIAVSLVLVLSGIFFVFYGIILTFADMLRKTKSKPNLG